MNDFDMIDFDMSAEEFRRNLHMGLTKHKFLISLIVVSSPVP